jgi:hypothetical protein
MLGLLILSGAPGARAQSPSSAAPTYSTEAGPLPGYVPPDELTEGRLIPGGGLGFLGNTPDGTAFAVNGSLDYFVDDQVSLGPLVQMGFTGDQALLGLSGQGKYWFLLPGTNGRSRAAITAGLGFMHADFRGDDTSFLIPIGVEYGYSLPSGVDLTATALVNFSDLQPGFGSDGEVMPGVTFGVQF